MGSNRAKAIQETFYTRESACAAALPDPDRALSLYSRHFAHLDLSGILEDSVH
jgi:hypothetical protein